MMNKFFSKTVRKTTLISTILAIVLAAAIVVCALFGFHKDVRLQDNKTLTVSVNTFAYNNQKEEIIKDCEQVFGKLNEEYSIAGEMGGDECEIVFVFDKDADVATMKNQLTEHFTNKKANDQAFANVSITLSVASEKTEGFVAKDFVLRSVIAGVIFTLLAFGYVAIRYKKVTVGLVAAASVALGMLMTASLIVLTRTFVTTSVAGVIAFAGLLTAASVLLTLGKIRAKAKEDKEIAADELVSSSIAVKETLWIGGGLAVAMILVGVVGKTAAAWFAVSALLGIFASLCVALLFAPAMYLSVKTWAEKRPAKNAYVGAKKSSKKKTDAPVEEAPVVEE